MAVRRMARRHQQSAIPTTLHGSPRDRGAGRMSSGVDSPFDHLIKWELAKLFPYEGRVLMLSTAANLENRSADNPDPMQPVGPLALMRVQQSGNPAGGVLGGYGFVGI